MKLRRKVAEIAVVEILENRKLLSVTVTATGSTLAIVGDDTRQRVRIDDSYTTGNRQTLISVDNNNNGSFTDRGDINGRAFTNITTFDIRLGGAGDTVAVILPDGYDGASKSFSIRTGRGADHISFTDIIGNPIRNSNVSLNINTGAGTDTLDLALADLSSSTFTGNFNPGAGNDTLNINAGGRVANSAVTLTADLSDGDDTLHHTIDWDNFDLLGSSSAWKASIAGGGGNDNLQVLGDLGNSAAKVQGLLELDLLGQDGNDTLSASLDQFDLSGGTLRLREDGGTGADQLSLTGSIAASTPGTVDALLAGGAGDDVLNDSVNASSILQYATPAGLTLDGGDGTDLATTSGSALVTLQNTEG